MQRGHILLVEDDGGLVITISDRLTREGFRVDVAGDGFLAVDKVADGDFDLVILDVMLPGIDGYEVCRRMRGGDARIPILMLTAKDRVIDKVVGLKLGADDYLTKPFEPDELVARIEALLRRVTATAAPARIDVLDLESARVDLRRGIVERDGRRLRLSSKEIGLLRHLASRHGTPVGRDEILGRVWGYRHGVSSRTVDVHVAGLRKKIEADPKHPVHLRTVHGIGYALECDLDD